MTFPRKNWSLQSFKQYFKSADTLDTETELGLGNSLLAAIAIHGIVLLTLSFTLPERPARIVDKALEITVVRPKEAAEKPEQADFLAKANQEGSGNIDEAAKPTTSEALEAEVEIQTSVENLSDFTPPPDIESKPNEQSQPLVTVATPQKEKADDSPNDEEQEVTPQPIIEQMLANTQKEIDRLSAELDEKTRAYAKRPNRKQITAATKEHIYAEYMEMWRRKVEQTGKLNYPTGHTGSVILHVAVRSDGSLEKVRIIEADNSSVINDAAVEIARLSAPYPPFPPDLKKKADILDIVRTWRFVREMTVEQ